MGQRYTGTGGTSGITYFYIPEQKDIFLTISKDGYTTKQIYDNEISLDLSNGVYTVSNPLTINLDRLSDIMYKGVQVWLPNYYDQNHTTLDLYVYAPNANTVTFTTSFNPSLNYSTVLDTYKRAEYTLQRGIHYCNGCGDNFNVTFWVNDQFHNAYVVEYIGIDKSRVVEPTGLNKDIKLKLAWIIMILAVGILGLLFKGNDDGS